LAEGRSHYDCSAEEGRSHSNEDCSAEGHYDCSAEEGRSHSNEDCSAEGHSHYDYSAEGH